MEIRIRRRSRNTAVQDEIGYGKPPQSTRFAPGQSGNPYSPHYRDLAPLWATGDYVPLLYSREAVERAASERFQLSPKS